MVAMHPTKNWSSCQVQREDAEGFLAQHAETRARFERVAELLQGFETPFGLELLSTVHWVVTREKAANREEVAARVYAWNDGANGASRHARSSLRGTSSRGRAGSR